MSSFVIDKKEYTKAAGFLAAVIETKNYYREPVMYLWNRREHRPYEAEDVRRDLQRVYAINAAAVAEQYHDHQREQDSADYLTEFEAAKATGLQLMRRGYTLEQPDAVKDLRRAVYGVISFLRSAQYQIEGEEHEKRFFRIVNKYYRGLYAVLQRLDGFTSDEIGCWGSFDALDPDGEEG
ncbi:hypothetical protein [Pseudoflavonifractor phocaeensis]|uniref:hypothetical protein n=1 Tax=Pseudoflavonifractor phocaeensis TaxID=1870988 RepID=UPI001F2E13CB|nr:hypothetical protein [Pseudoflavonifractor phocaeensis]MCF2662523.1 hypothetical protein [Pseudoflavonifractor phocaeensis]